MSSSSGYDACKQCGGVVDWHYEGHTGNELNSCMNCGWAYAVRRDYNEDGSPVLDAAGEPVYHVSELPGYGAYSLRWEGKGGMSGPLTEPWGDDFDAWYAGKFAEGRESVVLAASYVSAYRDGKVERVWGEEELPFMGDERRGYC